VSGADRIRSRVLDLAGWGGGGSFDESIWVGIFFPLIWLPF
jgi:hypothetical protein